MKWKDISSYSQGQKDRTPNYYELKLGLFRIRIRRHIHYDPSDWFVSSYPEIVGDCKKLKSKDIKEAQDEVVLMLRKVLEYHLELLRKEKQ